MAVVAKVKVAALAVVEQEAQQVDVKEVDLEVAVTAAVAMASVPDTAEARIRRG